MFNTVFHFNVKNVFWPSFCLVYWFALSTSIASENYNKRCEISAHSYQSPSISGCIFSSDKLGQIKFKLNGKETTPEICFQNSALAPKDIKQLLAQLDGVADNVTAGNTGVLLVNDSSDIIEAKLSVPQLSMDAMFLPPMKKTANGVGKAMLDNGLIFELSVREKANLRVSGDFGSIDFNGKCSSN